MKSTFFGVLLFGGIILLLVATPLGEMLLQMIKAVVGFVVVWLLFFGILYLILENKRK